MNRKSRHIKRKKGRNFVVAQKSINPKSFEKTVRYEAWPRASMDKGEICAATLPDVNKPSLEVSVKPLKYRFLRLFWG